MRAILLLLQRRRKQTTLRTRVLITVAKRVMQVFDRHSICDFVVILLQVDMSQHRICY